MEGEPRQLFQGRLCGIGAIKDTVRAWHEDDDQSGQARYTTPPCSGDRSEPCMATTLKVVCSVGVGVRGILLGQAPSTGAI